MLGKGVRVISPAVLKDADNVSFFVPGQSDEFWAPPRFQLEGDAGGENNGGGQLGGKVLLESVILQRQIGEEFRILLDITGDLGDKGSLLPEVVFETDSLLQKVANDLERWNRAEAPPKTSQDLEFSVAERERRVSCRAEFCHAEQFRNVRAMLFGFLVLCRDGDTRRCKQLPMRAGNFLRAKHFVKKQDGAVNRCVVEAALLTDVAHPVHQIAAVREERGARIVGSRRDVVHLSLVQVQIQIMRTDIQLLVNVTLRV